MNAFLGIMLLVIGGVIILHDFYMREPELRQLVNEWSIIICTFIFAAILFIIKMFIFRR